MNISNGFAVLQMHRAAKYTLAKTIKVNFVGIDNTKKLLEDIPNKVRDILGILVDVNLHEIR
jgi:ATP-dependent DNA helicase RecG